MALLLITSFACFLTAAVLTPPASLGATAPPPSDPDAPPADSAITALVSAACPLPPGPAVVVLARRILPPGDSATGAVPTASVLLAVESGALTLHSGVTEERADGSPTHTPDERAVRAGERLLWPPATGATLGNEGKAPAVVLAAALVPEAMIPADQGHVGAASPSERVSRWIAAWSPEATVQPLVTGDVVATPLGAGTILLRRMNLRAEDQVSLPGAAALAVVVEAGTLDIRAAAGAAELQHANGRSEALSLAGGSTLLAGDGALMQAVTGATLRNVGSGPLLVLHLSVTASGEAFQRPDDPGMVGRVTCRGG